MSSYVLAREKYSSLHVLDAFMSATPGLLDSVHKAYAMYECIIYIIYNTTSYYYYYY